MEAKFTIRQRREAVGMTLTDLEENCRIDKSLLSRIENNKYIPNTIEKKKIARALQCDPNDLLYPAVILSYGI